MQQKISGDVSNSTTTCGNQNDVEDGAITGEIFAAEFLAANFNGLLATQIARLVVFDKLRPVRFSVGNGSIFLYGFHASHTTTSCSSLTPKTFSTRPRTSAIRVSMSFPEASPALTKTLAWRSPTFASPQPSPSSTTYPLMR